LLQEPQAGSNGDTMTKFKYRSTTQRVSQVGLETEYFRYNLDKPEDIEFDDYPVMLDVESHGKDFNDVRLVQLFQPSWDKVIIFDTNKYPLQDIYDVIKHKHIVAHNVTYEMSAFQTDLGMVVNPFPIFDDTFLLARKALALKIEGFGFDSVAAYVHGYDYYKEYARSLGWDSEDVPKFKKSMQKSFLDSPKSYKRGEDLYFEQLQYAMYDVMLMSKVYKELHVIRDEWIIQLDYKFIPWALQYQKYGLPVDKPKWEHAWINAQSRIDEATENLPDKPGEPGTELLVNSWVQVRKLFDSTESDDTFLASVENDAVRYPDNPELETKAVWAKAIRQKRSAIKQQAFLKSYNVPRITGFVSPRTKSGRIAAESLNTLQIPRALKYIFGFEKKDKYLVYADFSNLELRMLAALINEEKMVEKFFNKEDLHSYSGSQIYEKDPADVTKAERFIGKFFNFSAGYGAGAARLCGMLMKEAGIYMTEDEMRPKLKKWKAAWPAIRTMHQINGRSKDNIARTIGGRVVKCDLYTDLNAIPPQGSSAEVFKLAHLYMIKSLPDMIMANSIHDSYIVECETLEDSRYTAKVVAYSMVVSWFETIKNSQVPTLPMPTDAVIGHNWQDLEIEAEGTETQSYSGTHEMYLEIREEVLSGSISRD
ncbi:MAG: hypothetical protein DRP93_06250, partial [Candidatus Neomarinimicrobiota bacterium]